LKIDDTEITKLHIFVLICFFAGALVGFIAGFGWLGCLILAVISGTVGAMVGEGITKDKRNIKHLFSWLLLCALGLWLFYWDMILWSAWCTVWGFFCLMGAPMANFFGDIALVNRQKAKEIREKDKE